MDTSHELITIRGISVAIEPSQGMFKAYERVSDSERYLLGIGPTYDDAVRIATRSLSDVDELLASGKDAPEHAKKKILKRTIDNHFQ